MVIFAAGEYEAPAIPISDPAVVVSNQPANV